jgi:hypothetical protein
MPARISISKKEVKWNFKSTGMGEKGIFDYKVNMGQPETGMKFSLPNLLLKPHRRLSPLQFLAFAVFLNPTIGV